MTGRKTRKDFVLLSESFEQKRDTIQFYFENTSLVMGQRMDGTG